MVWQRQRLRQPSEGKPKNSLGLCPTADAAHVAAGVVTSLALKFQNVTHDLRRPLKYFEDPSCLLNPDRPGPEIN
jgi:hypothetical protein